MSVFPAASGNFLPPTWRELMSNPVSKVVLITENQGPGVHNYVKTNSGLKCDPVFYKSQNIVKDLVLHRV